VRAGGVNALAPRLLKVGGETEVGALPTGFDRAGVKEHLFGVDFDGFIGRRHRGAFVEPSEDALGEVAFRERRRAWNEIATEVDGSE